MMRLQCHIERYDLSSRAHSQIMRQILRNVMTRHQYERLPKHFEELAYTEYGAQQRSAKYNERKQKKYGHQKPNVKTGKLRRSVLNKVKITATQHKANLYTRGTTRSRLAAWQLREIMTVSLDEQQLENKRMAREYKRLATSTKYARKRKRRTK